MTTKQNTYTEKTQQSREDQLIKHAPLVKRVVTRMAARFPPGVDQEELEQVGMIGLLDAVDKFDPTRDVQFKTYAEFRIKGAILDELRSMDWVPRSVRQKSRRLDTAYNEIEQRLGRAATQDEVADSLGVNLDELHTMINQARGISIVNLDELRSPSDSGGPLYPDVFEDEKAENPFNTLKTRELSASVGTCISDLPEKERLVMSLYYYEDLNMKEIGQVLSITESRVCQIHTKAVSRLRSKLLDAIEN